MNYLVIGNGFDLAHGLKTQYTDFLLYSIQREKSLYANYIKKNPVDNIDFIENVDDNFIKNISRNIWLYYFVDLYREHLLKGHNWIDFESEISFIVEAFDRKMESKYSNLPSLRCIDEGKRMLYFYNLYGILYAGKVEEVEKNTYDQLINNVSNDLERLIDALNYYLSNEVETSEITKISPDIENLRIDGILSFNYTTTIKRLYANMSKVPIHYIHGTVSREKHNNMVLGVNEYWNNIEASTHTDFNCLKKFTQRIIKNTGVEYRKWIYEATGHGIQYKPKRDQTSYKEMGLSNVFVYGHSLDVTDKELLKEFFDNNQIIVNVFYKDKIHQSNLIAAIVRMISEDDFLRQYYSYPQMIKFIQQSELK